MKKLFSTLLAAILIASVAGCSAGSQSSTQDDTAPGKNETTWITINSYNGNKEAVALEVPYNPQRLAVMDLAVLDILDNFGLGDRVVGVSKGSSIDYLQSYVTDDSIYNLGTIKDADLERVMESEPDVIFIGGRLSAMYDALSEIAPVVYLSTDVELGVVKSTGENAMTIASMFGMEEMVSGLMAEYDTRIDTLSAFAEGKTAIVGIVTNGGFNVVGNDGRCSIIGVEIGFENLSDSDATSTHGNESSFELLVAVEPDYIFIMDRDAAINAEGAQLAREIMENELVMLTSAHQNGNIVYLDHPNIWYTAEGGITALGTMLADLESALLN